MKKFDEMGLPLDNGRDYDKIFSKGGGEVIATVYSEAPPVTAPDVDYDEDELPEQAKEIEECLNEKEGYEQLEDDFFIKLMKDEGVTIKTEKEPNKKTKKVENRKATKTYVPKKEVVEEEVRETKTPI